jgi:hypothetical protein
MIAKKGVIESNTEKIFPKNGYLLILIEYKIIPIIYRRKKRKALNEIK